jgi:hypothetical protein
MKTTQYLSLSSLPTDNLCGENNSDI